MTDLSEYLNDPERNLLCDLLLAHLGLDRGTSSYRRIKNCVLLLSHDAADGDSVFEAAATIERSTPEEIERDVTSVLSALPRPAYELFDERYAVRLRGKRVEYMPRDLDTVDTLSFYATVLLYLTLDGYNDDRSFGY